MSEPLISVIVTTHNRPKTLERALNSLLKQKFKNFEIILCSDEGSAETHEVAGRHLRKNDIYLRTPKIKGPAGTRNLGIKVANGDWICFLDDDDEFEETFFERVSSDLFDQTKIIITDYKYLSFNEKSKQTIEKPVSIANVDREYLQVKNFIPINSIFVPAKIAVKYSFNEKLETHEDWDWILSLLIDCQLEFKNLQTYGPKIHIATSGTRNYKANNKAIHALDYLSIYRRWPATNENIKKKREETLKNLGISISHNFL